MFTMVCTLQRNRTGLVHMTTTFYGKSFILSILPPRSSSFKPSTTRRRDETHSSNFLQNLADLLICVTFFNLLVVSVCLRIRKPKTTWWSPFGEPVTLHSIGIRGQKLAILTATWPAVHF